MQLQFLTGGIARRSGRSCASRARAAAARAPQTTRRYEWAEAGALLHIDAMELPKFDRPGHWATATAPSAPHPRRRQDQGRRGRRRPHPPGLLRAALRRKRDDRLSHAPARRRLDPRARLRPGPGGHERQRQVLLDQLRVPRHAHRARRPPHPDPALHATLERQDRTLLPHARHRMGARPRLAQQPPRDRALSSFIRFYNRRRPHSAAGGRPPITRVHQLRGQDS